MCRCLFFGLSVVSVVLALAGVGVWLTGDALSQAGHGSIASSALFVACVFAAVGVVCAIFVAIETLTGPLAP